MSKLSCSVPCFVVGNVHVHILRKFWGSLFEKFITNCGFITNCVVTCAAICNTLAQQFVINKVITNCGVITNCVVSCAAICNKQAYHKLRRYYKLRGDKAQGFLDHYAWVCEKKHVTIVFVFVYILQFTFVFSIFILTFNVFVFLFHSSCY